MQTITGCTRTARGLGAEIWRKDRTPYRKHFVHLPRSYNKFWWCQPSPCIPLARLKSETSPSKPLVIIRHEDDKPEDFLRRSLGRSGLRVGKYVNGTTTTDLSSATATVEWRKRHRFKPLDPGCVIIVNDFDKWYEKATANDKQLIKKWSLSVDTHPTLVFIMESSGQPRELADEICQRYDANVVYTRLSMCDASEEKKVAEPELLAVWYLVRVVAVQCIAGAFWYYTSRPTREFPRPSKHIRRYATESQLKGKLSRRQRRPVVVLEGPRFCGKTSVVLRVLDDLGCSSVAINCHGPIEEVLATLRACTESVPGQSAEDAQDFKISVSAVTSRKALIEYICRFFWSTDQGRLVLLENLDDPEMAKVVLDVARSLKLNVIVTTQDSAALRSSDALSQNDPVVRMDKLTESEARRLAVSRLRDERMADDAPQQPSWWEFHFHFMQEEDERWQEQKVQRWLSSNPRIDSNTIDHVCRVYCDNRPPFINAVFTAYARTASDTLDMETWVRDHFTSLVTDDAKRLNINNKDHISINEVHKARRETLPVSHQAVYDGILGAIAALGTRVCPEELLQCMRDDYGDLVVGLVKTRMKRHWNILRADPSDEHPFSVHVLDLQGVEPNRMLAARVLLAQAKEKKKKNLIITSVQQGQQQRQALAPVKPSTAEERLTAMQPKPLRPLISKTVEASPISWIASSL
jgi:hypothetical protein